MLAVSCPERCVVTFSGPGILVQYPSNVLIISEEEVERLLDLTELQTEMEIALTELSAGRVTQPVRTLARVTEHDGWFGLMPVVYRDVIGAKLVTVFPRNSTRGMHTHQAAIHLFRAETGEPVAILGGPLDYSSAHRRCFEGLFRFPCISAFAELESVRPKAVYNRQNGLPAHDVYRIFEDSRGDIWISTYSHAANGLTRWERSTGTLHLYAERDNIPRRYLAGAFAEDQGGNVWIGFPAMLARARSCPNKTANRRRPRAIAQKGSPAESAELF